MILVGLWLIYLLSILLRLIHPSLCVISEYPSTSTRNQSCSSGLVAKTTTSDEEDGDVDENGDATVEEKMNDFESVGLRIQNREKQVERRNGHFPIVDTGEQILAGKVDLNYIKLD